MYWYVKNKLWYFTISKFPNYMQLSQNMILWIFERNGSTGVMFGHSAKNYNMLRDYLFWRSRCKNVDGWIKTHKIFSTALLSFSQGHIKYTIANLGEFFERSHNCYLPAKWWRHVHVIQYSNWFTLLLLDAPVLHWLCVVIGLIMVQDRLSLNW